MGKVSTRRKHTANFKATVAIEAIRERKTLSELSEQYEVSPVMISRWKKELLEAKAVVFQSKLKKSKSEGTLERLYAIIGKLKVENEFLKKNLEKVQL